MRHTIHIACCYLVMCQVSCSSRPSALRPKPASDKKALAVVTLEHAEFWFPVDSLDNVWPMGVSGDNAMEYSWVVSIPYQGAIMEVGYTLFQMPGAAMPAKVSLDTLLGSGQRGIWKKDESGASLVEGMTGVNIRRRDGGVLIELTNEKLLKALLDNKPAKLQFGIRGSMLQNYDEEVAAVYR